MDPLTIQAITAGLQTILPIVVGPGGAIVICFLGLGFCGWVTVKHVIPSIEKRFAEQQTNLSDLMKEHKEDRATFKEAITTLTMGQTAITNKMDLLVEEVKELADVVDDVGSKLRDLDDDVEDLKARKVS